MTVIKISTVLLSPPSMSDTPSGSPVCFFYVSIHKKFLRVAVRGIDAYTCRLRLKKNSTVEVEGTLEDYLGETTLLAANIKFTGVLHA